MLAHLVRGLDTNGLHPLMHDTTVSRARLAARQFVGALILVLVTYAALYAFVAITWAVFA